MPKEHFTMLAHTYNSRKYGIGGWFASEKLDGHRCIWIPFTRGLKKKDVPFANLYDVKRHDQICSGLWSRLGNVISAPNYWLDTLPLTFLDGELWISRGRGSRQKVASIIRKLEPNEEDWSQVNFHCFDLPSPESLFKDRKIEYSQKYSRYLNGVLEWWKSKKFKLEYLPKSTTPFESTNILLGRICKGYAIHHKQVELPFQNALAIEKLNIFSKEIDEQNGEGVILRNRSSIWEPHRSHNVLKVKKTQDAEGIVKGYITGRKTNKGSKLLGLMGALILEFNGKRLELSGFTERERSLKTIEGSLSAREWAENNPACEVPNWIESEFFPRGSKVTFEYRDLTRDGLPNEARYLRIRVDI